MVFCTYSGNGLSGMANRGRNGSGLGGIPMGLGVCISDGVWVKHVSVARAEPPDFGGDGVAGFPFRSGRTLSGTVHSPKGPVRISPRLDKPASARPGALSRVLDNYPPIFAFIIRHVLHTILFSKKPDHEF